MVKDFPAAMLIARPFGSSPQRCVRRRARQTFARIARSVTTLTLVLGMLAAGTAHAASGEVMTTSGTANAAIVSPLVLTHVSGASLNFGMMVVNSGGTVIVTYAGSSVSIGTVGLVTGEAKAPDAFTISGDANRSYSVTTGAGYVTSGSLSMLFATSPSATQASLGATGTGTITVGGSLQVTSNITSGVYSGTYTVTVAYD